MTASLAAVANQQSQLAAAANTAAAGLTGQAAGAGSASGSGTAAAGGASGSSAGTAGALGALTTNYNDFLTLLTTQLKNQDPSSPMDSSQFTSELVQFSGVEQQINTNTSLGQLIQLTQAGDLTQANAMLGSQVTATAAKLPLQNGKASLSFTAPAAEPVAIALYNAAGTQILDTAIDAKQGSNTWSWNGQDANGTTVPDGAYNVAVMGQAVGGAAGGAAATPAALPFTVTGTATGVTSGAGAVALSLGALSVPFTAVTSVSKPASAAGS